MDNILIGTNGTSYTITDATRNITINGMSSFTRENVLYVFNITQNLLYYAPVYNAVTPLNKITVSGDVITIDSSFAVLADTDELHIQMSTGDIAYDYTVDADKTLRQNPDYAYRTSPELIGFTNQAAGTYYYVIPWDTYKHGSAFVTAVTGASNTLTYTLWATNKYDVDLSTISELEWADVTNDLTGAASYAIAAATANYEALHWLDQVITVEYLMLKMVVVDGGTPSNSFGFYIKKAY